MQRSSDERSAQAPDMSYAKPRSASGLDRRHSFRVCIPGSASVWHKGMLSGYYAVRDLSIGGCGLRGRGVCRVNDEVLVHLHVPPQSSLSLNAIVARVDEQGLGLRFERTSPRAEDYIQDLVVNAFASSHAYAVGEVALVVEPRTEARNELVALLKRLGQPATGVASALDAVQLLLAQEERIAYVFIEAESRQLPSFELVEYLANQHPRVRRVLMGEGSTIGNYWSVEATGEVHALLETPCNEDATRRVLARLRSVPRGVTLS
jgi:CheY-like chemotaxis protein